MIMPESGPNAGGYPKGLSGCRGDFHAPKRLLTGKHMPASDGELRDAREATCSGE